MTGKWYCVDTIDNAATRCIDQADAEDLAHAKNIVNQTDIFRAMQLVDAKEVEWLKALLSDIRDFEVDSGVQRLKKGEPAFVMPVELRKRIQEVLK